MAKIDEVLSQVKVLSTKLYGENGFEGDITQIKTRLKENNEHFQNHSKRIRKVEIILAGLIGSGALGGGVIGLVKWLGS